MRKSVICNVQFVIVAVLSTAAFADTFTDAAKDYVYGDYQDSLAKSQNFINSQEAKYLAGLNYLKLGEYSQARVAFQAAISGNTKSIICDQARLKIADTYFLEKNYSLAKREYLNLQQTPVANNFLPLIYLRLAQIAAKEGNWGEKSAYLNKIKEQFPSSAEMKYVQILEAYGNFFTVQIGAFSSMDNAQAIIAELKGRYTAYIVKDVRPTLTVYRVRVGQFAERPSAESACEKLINEGFPAIVYP